MYILYYLFYPEYTICIFLFFLYLLLHYLIFVVLLPIFLPLLFYFFHILFANIIELYNFYMAKVVKYYILIKFIPVHIRPTLEINPNMI